MHSNERRTANNGDMAWLWAHNKDILDKLRPIVEPLAQQLSGYIEAEVASRGDVVAGETLATRVQHDIPFGPAYTLLPPRLFSELYDGAEVPRLPNDETGAHAIIESYRRRNRQPPRAGTPEGSYAALHEDRISEILSDLQWMMHRAVVIDAGKWERYRQAGRELAEHGRYDLDRISVSRGKSIKSMYHYPALARLVQQYATGSFDHFMTMPTTALDVDGPGFGLLPVGYLFMPVGAYGPGFGEKLLRTNAYMVNRAQQVLGGLARELAAAHPETVARHTTRVRDGRPPAASLITMTQEGCRSSMEVGSLLTADIVPGYDDPDQLYEDIVLQGIIEEFTRAIPQGVVGPLAFTGKYFPNLLLQKGKRKLVLNPEIMSVVKDAKREMAKQDIEEWELYWAASEEMRNTMLPPVSTSLLCPAAMPHGAVTRLNRAFLWAYKEFDF